MKRKKKIMVIALLGVTVVLLAFLLYVNQRGGQDYTEELARLLPADTPAYISLRNLNTLWTRIESMQFAQELGASGALSRLLLSSKEWQRLQQKTHRFERRTTLRLGERFIKRWFGRHVVFALISVPDAEQPGLLLLSKTHLGFEEKLAELVAQLYPGLKLRTERYRGSLINLYDAEKAKHAFSYLRFGRTVVLSLRSNNTAYLKHVIDLKVENSQNTLADSSKFQLAFAEMEKAEGLICYIIPQLCLRLLGALPSGTIQKHSTEQTLASLSKMLEHHEYWRVVFSVHNGFVGDFRFRYKATAQALSGASAASMIAKPSALSFLSIDTLGFFQVQGPDLRKSLTELAAFLELFPSITPEAWLSGVEAASGINPVRDIFPYMDNELTLALCNIQPGLLFPQFTAELFVKTSDTDTVRQLLAQRVQQIRLGEQSFPLEETHVENHTIRSCQTPFGPIGYGFLESYLVVMLGSKTLAENLAVRAAAQSNITANDLYKRVRKHALQNPSCILYVNFEEAANALRRVADKSLQWQQKIRAKVEKYHKPIEVLTYLKALCITTSSSPISADLRLYIPAE